MSLGPLAPRLNRSTEAELDELPAGAASIAVVIVNYNGRHYLGQCLDHLAAQTLRAKRVIVVDNASSDESLVAGERHYPTVEVIRLPKNIGFAAANNVAIRLATDCRWVALLNADAFPEPAWLEKLHHATVDSPEVAVLGCTLVQANDPAALDGTGDVYHVSGVAWRRDWGRPVSNMRRTSAGTVGPCAAAAMYRRDALLDVNGFDEDFFCYLEDVDLGLRLRLAGYQYRHVSDATVRHVGSAITVKHSDFYLYHGHRNLPWVYVKNMPGVLFWLFLPQHLLLNLASVVYFALRGRGRVLLRAKRDAIGGLPRFLRKRRQQAAQRKVSLAATLKMLNCGAFLAYARSWR
ncbi:MAG: glycosyltransferase family 2 protein [Planctomycetes bacterium]|nr:glycosyltransferase family 2 protein [Planctomycetota bacterium]